MSQTPKPETAPARLDEERLAHALVSRGLITADEVQHCRQEGGDEGPQAFLTRLVEARFLTANQARRAAQELKLLLGQRIPGYVLLEKLGQGSMGLVYKARQLSMNRLVAIKVLPPRWVNNAEFLELLQREARLAAKLSHNNIVQAIDVGSAGTIHYFVMEYVEGTTIKQELEKGKIYAEREAVEIALQIAQALAHARRRGLIHRDLKPSNILLTPDGIAKLADLGLARETADQALARAEKGMTIGTPYYISPEQVRGQEDVDVRADIYSLGATLYHMVTGQPPFPGTDPEVLFEAHLKQELTPPDHVNTRLSAGLGEVVEFMMAKDRGQRYRTPDDLLIDLECLLNGEPPRLAHQRMEAATLRDLAEGEVEDDGGRRGRARAGWKDLRVWAGVLAVLLAASLLVNWVLLLKR